MGLFWRVTSGKKYFKIFGSMGGTLAGGQVEKNSLF